MSWGQILMWGAVLGGIVGAGGFFLRKTTPPQPPTYFLYHLLRLQSQLNQKHLSNTQLKDIFISFESLLHSLLHALGIRGVSLKEKIQKAQQAAIFTPQLSQQLLQLTDTFHKIRTQGHMPEPQHIKTLQQVIEQLKSKLQQLINA